MRTLLRYAFHFTAAVASLVHISYGTVLASQHAQNAALRDLDATWKAWEEDKGSNRRIKIPPPTPEQLRALRTWTALAADLPPSTAQKVAHLQAEILETLLNYKVSPPAPFALAALSASIPALCTRVYGNHHQWQCSSSYTETC